MDKNIKHETETTVRVFIVEAGKTKSKVKWTLGLQGVGGIMQRRGFKV